jgi:hypothetical protein
VVSAIAAIVVSLLSSTLTSREQRRAKEHEERQRVNAKYLTPCVSIWSKTTFVSPRSFFEDREWRPGATRACARRRRSHPCVHGFPGCLRGRREVDPKQVGGRGAPSPEGSMTRGHLSQPAALPSCMPRMAYSSRCLPGAIGAMATQIHPTGDLLTLVPRRVGGIRLPWWRDRDRTCDFCRVKGARPQPRRFTRPCLAPEEAPVPGPGRSG